MVSSDQLREAALAPARVIASHPPRAVQATVRTLWAARELATRQAIELGAEFLNLGSSREDLAEGQERFTGGQRGEWRLR